MIIISAQPQHPTGAWVAYQTAYLKAHYPAEYMAAVISQNLSDMRISIDGTLQAGVTAKDMALYLMSKMTTSGATGYFVEYAGEAVRNLSMEGRLTLCNLSIEMGARGGMVAPDEKTFAYIKGKEHECSRSIQNANLWNSIVPSIYS